LYLKPAELTYRDTVELGIGESKKVILFIDKFWTLLHWSDIEVQTGVLRNNKLEPLPENLSIGQPQSSRVISPQGRNQRTVLPISASNEILPGNYIVHIQLEAPFFGKIGRIPLNIVIHESSDDIIDTPEGPVYRSNKNEQNKQVFQPVDEKTIKLGNKQLPFTYRDSIEMTMGGYKGIIMRLGTTDLDLEEAHYEFTIVSLEDGQAVPFSDRFEIENTNVHETSNPEWIESVLTIKHLLSQSAQSFNLAIMVEAEEIGLIGHAPLTLSVIESPDDIVVIPSGETYRSSKQVQQKTVLIPSFRGP